MGSHTPESSLCGLRLPTTWRSCPCWFQAQNKHVIFDSAHHPPRLCLLPLPPPMTAGSFHIQDLLGVLNPWIQFSFWRYTARLLVLKYVSFAGIASPKIYLSRRETGKVGTTFSTPLPATAVIADNAIVLFVSDCSQEYTDSTGIDLHECLINTLKNNSR